MRDDSARILELFAGTPVIPVIVVRSADSAQRLAGALVEGGLKVLEVTLRTKHAIQAINEMSRVSGCTVGAGTLLSGEDARRAKAAGAQFGVSPMWLEEISTGCDEAQLPLLPGVSTATEIAVARREGYNFMKFFPAVPAGGIPALKAFSGPFNDLSFCPTGGINADNAQAFLNLENVSCVGGSWVAPEDLVAKEKWNAIVRIAHAAAQLGLRANAGRRGRNQEVTIHPKNEL